MTFVSYELDGKTINARVQQKTDTLANWEANTLVLKAGEPAFVVSEGGAPINFKIGDGTKRFSDLPWWIDYAGGQYVQVAGNALPTPTVELGYTFVGPGTYTHAGGNVVAPDGRFSQLVFQGGTWSLKDMGALPKGQDGEAILPEWSAKTEGWGDRAQVVHNGIQYVSLVAANTEEPSATATNWGKPSIADGIVEKGNKDATSGNSVFKNSRELSDTIGKINGGNFSPIFTKGGLLATGEEVEYNTSQPRMRTDFIRMANVGRLIQSNNFEFAIYVYDNTKKFRYYTIPSLNWVSSMEVQPDKGYFRIVARKKSEPYLISESDLLSDITVNSFTLTSMNRTNIQKVESSLGTSQRVLKFTRGAIDDSNEEVDYSYKHAVFSGFFKTTGSLLNIAVNAGYKVRVKIYSGLLSNKDTLISTHASAQSHNINLDGQYYVRLVIASDNSSDILNPESVVSATGLTYSGMTPEFSDVGLLPFAQRAIKQIVSYQNGYYDYVTKEFKATADKKSFLYSVGETNAYLNINVNPDFFINYSIWNGNVLVETVTFRSYLSLYLKKGQDITIAIGKRDFSNFTGAEVIGLTFNRVDEKKETVGFINLSAKLHKSHFNADEYGMRLDNSDNSDALNNLIEYLVQHGGGRIMLPIGILDFANRVTAKSNVDIYGYGRGKSIMRMVGNAHAFSLIDNKSETVFNVNYRDFTIDGYSYNPSVPYTSDMKAFNFHHVKQGDFSYLEVKGSPASGIGIDYLYGVTIANNIVTECGRMWLNNGAANMQGGSGIGIGTGGDWEENFVVIGNIVEKCGQNGIFIEDQGIFSGANTPPGRGNLISNNIVRGNRKNGMSARGNTRCTFDSNIVYSNVENGFFADKYLREIKLTNNQFITNPNGIKITHGDTRQSYDVDIYNNLIKDSNILALSVTGISNNGNTARYNIEGNKVVNSPIGIQLAGTTNDFMVRANKVRNITGNALDISGTHANMVFEDNSIRGTVSNTATFTGDTSENELV